MRIERSLFLLTLVSLAFSQAQPELLVNSGMGDSSAGVVELAFGGGGKWIAIGSARSNSVNFTIRILDVATGHVRRIIPIPGPAAYSTDPVGDRLAVMSNGETTLFDVESGAPLWKQSVPAEGGRISSGPLQFSADGHELHTLTWHPVMKPLYNVKTQVRHRVLDPASGRELQSKLLTLDGRGASFSADLRWVLTTQGRIRRTQLWSATQVYDLASGQPVGPELEGIPQAAHAGAHRLLVSRISATGQNWQLLDVPSGKTIPLDTGGMIGGAAFSPDGRLLVMSMVGVGWRIFDAATGKTIFPGNASLPYIMGIPSFDPTGALFVMHESAPVLVDLKEPGRYRVLGSASTPVLESGTVAKGIQEVLAQEQTRPLSNRQGTQNPNPAAPGSTVTPDGRWLVARAGDNQLDFWDASTGNRMPFRVQVNFQSEQPLHVSRDGRYLMVESGTFDTTQRLQRQAGRKVPAFEYPGKGFSILTVDLRTAAPMPLQQTSNVHCLAEGSEYAVVLGATPDGIPVANLRSTADPATIAELTQLGIDLSPGCTLSPDGSRIVVNKVETRPVAWTLGSWQQLRYAPGFFGRDSSLLVYDLRAKRVATQLQDAKGQPGKFPFSPDRLCWSADGSLLSGGGHVWEAGSGRLLLTIPVDREHRGLAITPDGTQLVDSGCGAAEGPFRMFSTPGFGVGVLDLRTGKQLYSLPDASNVPGALSFHPNGRVILGPHRSGTVGIWRRSDGTLLGRLHTFEGGDWLVDSPAGLFDGSPRGWARISWRGAENQFDSASGELFFNDFYRPGLLGELLAGSSPEPARVISQMDRRQPAVTIEVSAAGERAAMVRIVVREAPAGAAGGRGSGARDLRLFRNGLLLKAWRGDLALDSSGSATFETTVPVTAGENRLTAYAFNAQNVRSAEPLAVFQSAAAPRQGVAYVLAIGINEYANPDFNLKYAVADAEALAARIAAKQQGLKQFSAVHTVLLTNREATRAHIRLALDLLSGARSGPLPPGTPASLSSIRRAEPEDTVIISFAGHGVSTSDRFYFIPYDLGYTGPRSAIGPNLQRVLDNGISDQDLDRALEPLDARHLVLVIDACQSGQALSSDDERRGPMNSRGLAQLAWEKGMSILAAAQGYQAALESEKLGHGYLTFALVEEALNSPVADSTPPDGQITSTEWLEYATRRVPLLQVEALEQAREANRALTFANSLPGAGRPQLQTPRLFTRREAPQIPLIMGKP